MTEFLGLLCALRWRCIAHGAASRIIGVRATRVYECTHAISPLLRLHCRQTALVRAKYTQIDKVWPTFFSVSCAEPSIRYSILYRSFHIVPITLTEEVYTLYRARFEQILGHGLFRPLQQPDAIISPVAGFRISLRCVVQQSNKMLPRSAVVAVVRLLLHLLQERPLLCPHLGSRRVCSLTVLYRIP